MSGRISVTGRIQGTSPVPTFELRGGPYDGLTTDDRTRIESVLYFPHEIHVKGPEGSVIYSIESETVDGVTVKFGQIAEA